MKRVISMLLVLAAMLSLCACSAGKQDIGDITDEQWEAAAEALADWEEEDSQLQETSAETQPQETEPQAKTFQLGEVITSADGMVELRIDSFTFADFVDWGTYEPRDSIEQYNIAAPQEKTFLCIDGEMTFVGETKQTLFYAISQDQVDYQDGYIFQYGNLKIWSFEDNMGAQFEPLTGGNVRDVKYYIAVPEAVAEDPEGSLLLTFEFGGPTSPYFDVVIRLR